MIALAFLQSQRLKQARGGKNNRRTSAAIDTTRNTQGNPQSSRSATAKALPALPQIHQS
jgi:hypothetical protein